jgi:hypothetical protein
MNAEANSKAGNSNILYFLKVRGLLISVLIQIFRK